MHSAFIISFWLSQVSGAHIRGFAPESTFQDYNGGDWRVIGNLQEI